MKELTEEQKKNFLEWSEGNRHLYDLLCACWEHEIATFASCGGHEDGNDTPYLGILLDEKSLPFVKKILGQLQDMKNISISFGGRHNGDGMLYDEEKGSKAITFYAHNHNCCEMFNKMKKEIESTAEIELNPKAQKFYDSVEKFSQASKEELQSEIDNGATVGSTFSTTTQDFLDYRNSKKLAKNSKIARFIRRLLPFRKTSLSRFEELDQKYGSLQRDYHDTETRENKGLKQYRVEDFDDKKIIEEHMKAEAAHKMEDHEVEDHEADPER